MKSNVWMYAMLLVAAFVVTSCSSDSDEEIIKLSSENIVLTVGDESNRAGVGQLIIASAKTDTPLNNPTYTWYVDQEQIADTEEINWIPKKAGTYTLEVLIEDGASKMSMFKNITVQESDYRYCFWGESYAAVVINEAVNAMQEHNVKVEPILTYLPAFIAYNDLDDSNLGHTYFLDNDMNIIKGRDVIVVKHASSEADMYIDDYNKQIDILTEKYGKPLNKEIIQLKAYTSSLSYGEKLVYGQLRLQATWQTATTDIELSMQKGSSSSIQFYVTYEPRK